VRRPTRYSTSTGSTMHLSRFPSSSHAHSCDTITFPKGRTTLRTFNPRCLS